MIFTGLFGRDSLKGDKCVVSVAVSWWPPPDPLSYRGYNVEMREVYFYKEKQPFGSPPVSLTKESQGNCLHLFVYLLIHVVLEWFLSIHSDPLVEVFLKYHYKFTNWNIFDFSTQGRYCLYWWLNCSILASENLSRLAPSPLIKNCLLFLCNKISMLILYFPASDGNQQFLQEEFYPFMGNNITHPLPWNVTIMTFLRGENMHSRLGNPADP